MAVPQGEQGAPPVSGSETRRPRLWQRLKGAVADGDSLRGWTIDANDGIIATAGLLQGFGGAGADDRVLLLAATAATIAGGLSIGGAKWAEAAGERDAQLRAAEEERAELERDLSGEIVELAAHWEARGLSPATARIVAEELTEHDALAAQLEAEYGIDEILTAAAPVWTGVSAAIAFMVGAGIPLLITWLVPVTIETTAIVAAVVISLGVTSMLAARVGRLRLGRVLTRTLVVGLGTMAVSYGAGLLFF